MADYPFLDLRAQYAGLREEILAAVAGVFERQQFILGSEVEAFEREFAAWLGGSHGIGCGSGTDALLLALLALGIGAGDEVITTPFTFFATAAAIARAGARPVFVDIEPESFNLDPVSVAAAITPRTRALLPVHLFGRSAAMPELMAIAARHRIRVIEDACQAAGAENAGRRAGTEGDAGCFSFFPSKNLGGVGDGGFILTSDTELAERLRRLRVHGSSERYVHQELGLNSRLDALQAAVLRIKLRHLAAWNQARREKAAFYSSGFEATGLVEWLAWPQPVAGHVFHQYVIRARRRDELRAWLSARGIPTEIYYPIPLHLQPALQSLGYRAGDFPEAERACREALALPIYPELPEARQQFLIAACREFYTA